MRRLVAEAGLDAAVARAGLGREPVVEAEVAGAAGLAEGAAGAVVAAALEQLDAGRAARAERDGVEGGERQLLVGLEQLGRAQGQGAGADGRL